MAVSQAVATPTTATPTPTPRQSQSRIEHVVGEHRKMRQVAQVALVPPARDEADAGHRQAGEERNGGGKSDEGGKWGKIEKFGESADYPGNRRPMRRAGSRDRDRPENPANRAAAPHWSLRELPGL